MSSADPSLRPLSRRDPNVRPYPFPAKAWLTLSNDPDNTRWPDWQELHRIIFEELELPFADSVFIKSYNEILKEQVDLAGHPEILAKHAHDTLHTWGDYQWAGARGFHRPDAVEALATIKGLGFTPRVWIDHSYFQGNMLHVSRYGSMPMISDRSGHSYPNPAYTLDLVKEAGVRYLWDGTITPVLGQDRPMSSWQLHRAREQSTTRVAMRRGQEVLRSWLGDERPRYHNEAHHAHHFPDGQVFRVFQRYGHWDDADVDGLARTLAPERMDELIAMGGTCIAYTHLGKRNASRGDSDSHVPAATVNALRHVRRRWKEGSLAVSSTSRMLDYLVLRDRIIVDTAANTVDLRPDGITFQTLMPNDLAGHRFTVRSVKADGLRVLCDGKEVQAELKDNGPEGVTITFAA